MQQLLPFLYRLALSPDKKDPSLIREFEEVREAVKPIADENKMMVPILQLEESMGLHEEYTERMRTRTLQDEAFTDVVKALSENGIRFIYIKGNAVKTLYPEGCPRQMGDYDLVVPDLDEFWKLISLVMELGFDYQMTPSFGILNDEVVGVGGFFKQLDNCMIELEVSVGSFVMGEVSWLSGDFWGESRLIDINGVDVPVPSPEDMILILTGESVGNKLIRLRDAVDLHLLLAQPELDYHKLHARLKRHHLDMEFYQLIQYYEQVSGQKANIPEFMLEGFSNRLFAKHERLRKHFYHYIPYNVDQDGVFTALLLQVLNLYRNKFTNWTVRRKRLKLVRFSEKFFPVLARYKFRILAHLIPVPSGDPGAYRWIRLKGKMVVRTPVGWFVASCFGLETREELIELDRAIAEHCATGSEA